MEALFRDLRQALRSLRRSPLFAATAIVTLALGIGATTAIFSVFSAVVLEPVPFAEPDTLVQLVTAANGEPIDSSASPAMYAHWSEQAEVIEDVAAYRTAPVNYTGADGPERVTASYVTPPYFRAFRAPMTLGRPFAADEDQPAAPKATVLSYAFWARRLGADPGVVGTALTLNGMPHTVVGVTAPEFDTRDLGHVELWMPLPAATAAPFLKVAARLRPGVSLEQAQTRLAASTAAFRERVPTALRDEVRFSAVPFQDAVIATGSGSLFRNDPRRVLWVLFGAVTFVLLIACANVASLMLAHASARERDIAVRSALGAGRSAVVRQLLTESALISGVGGGLGLALGFFGARALLGIDTAGLPRLGNGAAPLSMDWRIVAFAVSVSIATVILSGLFPALAASRPDLSSVIKGSSGSAATGFRKYTGRSAVVVAQTSLALVLLVGAALLIRTTFALGTVDPGFNVDDVAVLRTDFPEPRARTSTAVRELSRSTLERVRAMPGVEAAAASCCVPLQRSWGQVFKIVGRDDAGRPFSGGGDITIGTAGYFDVFEIPLVRGRVFDERDESRGVPVIVVNRALAERWWPDGQDPLGERIQIAGGDEPAREVIGVVENERKARLDLVRPILYVPLTQISDAWLETVLESDSLAWIVRASTDPGPLTAAMQREIRQSTGQPVAGVATMREILSESIARQRANAVLMTAFGGVALLLAAIGVYGLVAYSVQQRTHEIGIRMALGARGARILASVIGDGARLVAIGIAIGTTAAFFLAGVLASMLYGVEARDVAVFVTAPVTLALAALAAVSIPAYRASRVDPLRALRGE
jgi:putative ABC transport system permease protein